jgi:hypothetical protein
MQDFRSISGLLLLLTVAAWSVTGVSNADAAVLCAKKKNPNKVKLRAESCKRNEVEVTLAPSSTPSATEALEELKAVDGAGSGLDADTVRGLAPEQLRVPGPPGPQGDQGPPGEGGGGLVVRDGNGVVIGLVVEVGDDRALYSWGRHWRVVVVRRIDDRIRALRLGEGGFSETEYLDFGFESANCTGQPFVTHPEVEILSTGILPFVNVHDATGYYLTGPVTTRMVRSRNIFTSEEQCGFYMGPCTFTPPDNCCCSREGQFFFTSEVATVDLSSFVLPFSVDEP